MSTLSLYDETLDNVLFWVGDNCSVNTSLGNITGIPLIGCSSHRLNLAFHHWTETEHYSAIITEVNVLMGKCRALKAAAMLREHADAVVIYKLMLPDGLQSSRCFSATSFWSHI